MKNILVNQVQQSCFKKTPARSAIGIYFNAPAIAPGFGSKTPPTS